MKQFKRFLKESKLDESLDNELRLKIFDKLKKNDIVSIKYSSSIAKGKDYREFKVVSKKRVGKGKTWEQDKITLQPTDKTGGVKFYLYKRNEKVFFAIGDMGATIDDIKESFENLIIKEEDLLKGTSDEKIVDEFYKNFSKTRKEFLVVSKIVSKVAPGEKRKIFNQMEKVLGEFEKYLNMVDVATGVV